MGIYGHAFNEYILESNYNYLMMCNENKVVDALKSFKESIKRAIVNLIDKINGWLDKHPNSKVATGLKNILTKFKGFLTRADKVDNKDEATKLKDEVNKGKEEAEELMKEESSIKITPEFKEAVDNKKLMRVRIMIKNSILYDPEYKTLNLYLNYANKNLPDLFVEDDGSEYKNKSEWDADYFNYQMTHIMNNFSKKRLDHCKEVLDYLKKNNMI